ncbi:hypothetical protein EJ06DRAFT_526515 [Trichodelitschia bisporula]|uniref:Probable beta-glucosidase E n=1 Tax=Trichodelitschia bisporula TaxID=703511 RepID=A0A6G1I8J0_9PEZI|nr:hypothetical protein EJ06DRAFT_526515 [Trichodelitschia bisporula]
MTIRKAQGEVPVDQTLLDPSSAERSDDDDDAYDDADLSDAGQYRDAESEPLTGEGEGDGRRKDGRRNPEVGGVPPRSKSWARRWLIPTKFGCGLILLFFATVTLLLIAGGMWGLKMSPLDGQSPPWYPSPRGGTEKTWAKSYKKAHALVRQMTLVEKVNVTTGVGWSMGMCVGNTGPVERLGFPSLCLQDGPLGIRFADNITAFPAGVTVGATWNRELMYLRGKAHANEARRKGVNVILGPVVGPLGRTPLGGRNWEGFGSDPVLQAVAAAETIRGIQSEGVIATIKHFVGNEQEHFRQSWEWGRPNAISSNIDDRTLHELYVWPFAESVRAGVGSLMCSYNQVNNSYACQNSKLLNGILKDELGFQGFVQSDWLAQRGGVASALAGLDMNMPGDGLRWSDGKSLWGGELTKAVLNGSVTVERLDDMVTRIVATWYQLEQDDTTKWPELEEGPNFSSWTDEQMGLLHPGSDDKTIGVVNKFVDVQSEGTTKHGDLVRKIGAEGTVLVKNSDDFLPLDRKGPGNIGHPYRVGIFGDDSRNNPKGINSCKDRACSGGTLAMGWGSGAVEYPYLIAPLDALKEAFDQDTVTITSFPRNKLSVKEEKAMREQDLCLVFLSSNAGEGYVGVGDLRGDRNDLQPQNMGASLVKSVVKKCGNGKGDVVVVIHSVGPVLVEDYADIPNVKAILFANLPGQESGNSLVDVLFGEVNPSGRLPYTIGKSVKDYGPAAKIITATKQIVPQQNFSEGLLIDYRHFDYYNITPRYEFGFGLSYTKFQLSSPVLEYKDIPKRPLPYPRSGVLPPPRYDTTIPDPSTALFPAGFRKLRKYVYPYISSIKDISQGKPQYPPGFDVAHPSPLSPAGGGPGGNPDLFNAVAEVKVILSNLGPRDGSSVVQLYVSLPRNYVDEETGEKIDFPVRVLRNWQKIEVKKDGRQEVAMQVTRKDMSYWSTTRQNWVMPTKQGIKIEIGFSSRDIRETLMY